MRDSYQAKGSLYSTVLVAALSLFGCNGEEKKPQPERIAPDAVPVRQEPIGQGGLEQTVAHADVVQKLDLSGEFTNKLQDVYNGKTGVQEILNKLHFDTEEEKHRLLPKVEKFLKADSAKKDISAIVELKRYNTGSITNSDAETYGFSKSDTSAEVTVIYEIKTKDEVKRFLKVSVFEDNSISFLTSKGW